MSQIIRYSGYTSPENGKDIALLKLSTPLDLTDPGAHAVPYATAATVSAGRTDPGIIATVSGWGTLTSGSNSLPANLDCRPYTNGNDESCSFDNPQAGTYYVSIRGYKAYSSLSLNARVEN